MVSTQPLKLGVNQFEPLNNERHITCAYMVLLLHAGYNVGIVRMVE